MTKENVEKLKELLKRHHASSMEIKILTLELTNAKMKQDIITDEIEKLCHKSREN